MYGVVSVTLHSFTTSSIWYITIIRLMTYPRRYRISILLALLLIFSVEGFAQTARRMREHEVQREETVYSISRKYNTSVERIYELNPWAKKQIKVGDRLLIPTDTATPTRVQERIHKHRVEAGETLYRITKIYGIELSDLLRANPGVTSSNVQVGMELNIPMRREEGSTTAAEIRDAEHKVDSTASQVASAPTRVLMLLPLTQGRRYVSSTRASYSACMTSREQASPSSSRHWT